MVIQYFSGNVPRTNAHLVCYTAVFIVVTQERCVTTLKTAGVGLKLRFLMRLLICSQTHFDVNVNEQLGKIIVSII